MRVLRHSLRLLLFMSMATALIAPVAAEAPQGVAVLSEFDQALQRFDRARLTEVLAHDARVSVTTCRSPETVKSGADFIESTVSMAPSIKAYRRTREGFALEDATAQGKMILSSRVHEAIEGHGGYAQQGWSSETATLDERGGRLVITSLKSKMDCP